MTQPNALQTTTLHGVFLDVFGLGTLLTGPSGIGKSELALGLINRNHCLIADDSVEFVRYPDGQIKGHCHPILQDFLEVRGLGPLNVRAMFGDNAIKASQKLNLIVRIQQLTDEELVKIDRLHGMNTIQHILDMDIPEVTIPVSPGRNLAILIEGAVRNQLLKLAGYDAGLELCKRQEVFMAQSSEESL